MSKTSKSPGEAGRQAWPLLVLLLLVVSAVLTLLLFGCAAQRSSQPSGQEPRAEREAQPSKPGGDREEAPQGGAQLGRPSLGDADAPVVMVEYGDFQ